MSTKLKNSNTPLLTVIIVNYNRAEMLGNCLSSLLSAGCKNKLRVIVVDNASNDNSVSIIQNDFPWVELVKNKTNLGFAKANNQALKLVNSQYTLLLNNDTLVLPNTFDIMIDFFMSHPNVGLATCTVLNTDRSIQHQGFNKQSVFKVAARLFGIRQLLGNKSSIKAKELLELFYTNRTNTKNESRSLNHRDAFSIMGAFFMFPSYMLNEVGLLDETTFMYSEEGEWAYRVHKINKRVCVLDHQGVIHIGGSAINLNPKTNPFLYVESAKGIINIFSKHHRYLEFITVKLLVIISSIIKLIIFSIAGKFGVVNGRRLEAYVSLIKIAKNF